MAPSPRKKTRKGLSKGFMMKLRYLVVLLVLVLMLGWIISHLVDTTVVHRDDWNKKANVDLMRSDTIAPRRGEILAADGSVLATNLRYYTLRIDFRASKFREDWYRASVDSLSDSLAKYHSRRSAREWREYLLKPLEKSPKERLRSFTLLRDVSYAEMERVKTFPYFRRSKNRNRTGLRTEDRIKRTYPYGDMARRSVGRVGVDSTRNNEVHGVSGLEFALDEQLYGRVGYAKRVPLTREIVNWTDIAPVNGATLHTTIDIAMQDILERELSAMLAESKARWGTAILMETATGDIKAISNLELDSVRNTYIEAQNYAVQGYEPGSVMKVLSMTVALEDGYANNLDQLYDIGHSLTYAGAHIYDTHSPDRLPVRRFLEYSSNIGMVRLMTPHYRNNLNGFRDRLREMGLFEPFGTGIAGERPPVFRTLDPKTGGYLDQALQVYGYVVKLPVLYTCAFYNALANDGKFVRPRLVKQFTNERGDSIVPVTYVRDSICSRHNARLMREMLREVVYGKGGTARTAQNKYVEIAGKTGTAQVAHEIRFPEGATRAQKDSIIAISPKGYDKTRHRLAFCGFFPYDRPQYTCMVVIAEPREATHRAPNRTSVIVVRNVAMKMFSRGMLGNTSDYRAEAPGGAEPVVHASSDPARDRALRSMLGADKMRKLSNQPSASGVPNVRGMSVREAVRTLEAAGYNVHARGTGAVHTQQPAAGTRLAKGKTVKLTLSN